jgi:O-antigen ligase
MFLICAFGLIGAACEYWHERKWRVALALLCFAALFLGNIAFVITSRTVFVVAPALVFVLGWRQFGLRGTLAACVVAGALAGALWFSSSTLRERIFHSIEELSVYRDTNSVYLNSNEMNSTGLHVEFFRKSLQIMEAAPFIGHGTGSIPDQFRRAATGKTDAAAVVTVNPHNQIFAVTIRLGLLGMVVLLAMWVAHFMLFRGGGMTAWIGTIIVVQNVASSLFNSHLFDFTQGWLYVFGVGIAGGTVLRVQRSASAMAKP